VSVRSEKGNCTVDASHVPGAAPAGADGLGLPEMRGDPFTVDAVMFALCAAAGGNVLTPTDPQVRAVSEADEHRRME